MAIISSKLLTICYKHEETRPIIGWYEYQIEHDVRRYVPIYEEADRVRVKQFWHKDWDGLEEDWT